MDNTFISRSSWGLFLTIVVGVIREDLMLEEQFQLNLMSLILLHPVSVYLRKGVKLGEVVLR